MKTNSVKETIGRTLGRPSVWIPVLLASASLLWAKPDVTRVDPLPPASRLSPPFVFSDQPIRLLIEESFQSVPVQGVRGLGSVIVHFTGRGIALSKSGGPAQPLGSGVRLEPSMGGFLEVRGTRYRGFLEAFRNPLGVAVLVNEVAIEDYLRAVLPPELNPRLFPQPEALKAQAVASRTYALAELGRRARHGFDLFADQRSQVYGGADWEQDAADLAVRATQGIVAAYSAAPITAFYSSTCGGVTASYEETFQSGNIPYLKGGAQCPDEASRYHQWRQEIRIAEIQSELDSGVGVGVLKQLEILERDGHGRAARVLFEGSDGSKVVRGLDARRILGLRSHYITSLEIVRGSQGQVEILRVEGKGFGHGVGMCQIGAVELARRGTTFEAILHHYYQGIELLKIP